MKTSVRAAVEVTFQRRASVFHSGSTVDKLRYHLSTPINSPHRKPVKASSSTAVRSGSGSFPRRAVITVRARKWALWPSA